MATSCKQNVKEVDATDITSTTTDASVTAPATTAPATGVVPADGKYPVMAFAKSEHDFGTIKANDKVTYDFTFTNTGTADLIITDAKGSCGCTVPEYPKDPIKPGQGGKIKVSFDSANKKGQQSKTVNITTNTAAGAEKLTIKTTILDAAAS